MTDSTPCFLFGYYKGQRKRWNLCSCLSTIDLMEEILFLLKIYLMKMTTLDGYTSASSVHIEYF